MAQEITSKNTIGNPQSKLGEGEIRPNETTTVFSTGTTPHTKAGQPMEVHVALAKKLIESGKAAASEKDAVKAPAPPKDPKEKDPK